MSLHETLIPTDEAGRLAAVRRYDVLDTPPDGAFERITALAARHFGVPISIVSIVDSDRIWFKAHHGVDVPEIGRDPGLCASAILGHHPWVVENAAADPRTLANPLVAGELGLRFYAGAPLTTHDGYNLGTLCVIDREPREFTAEDESTLADLAAVVMDELELRLASRRAVDHELALRRQAEWLARALQASLLPPDLPAVPGADLAALYRPADAAVVGGDFYDAFPSGESCVLVVVGDVSGKDAGAAAVTALARHAIRTASLSATSLSGILDLLNRAMLLGRPGPGVEVAHFCTVLIVSVSRDRDGLRLVVTAAGHPPALILRADGSTVLLGADGPPVGWYPDPTFAKTSAHLDRGDALLLFTDGVTDARTPTGFLGHDGLIRRLGPGASAAKTAQDLVDALAELLAGDDIEVRDDVAALAVRAV
jgi:sigma-B regulation protein RsbU (phosphoserine phosphatase)